MRYTGDITFWLRYARQGERRALDALCRATLLGSTARERESAFDCLTTLPNTLKARVLREWGWAGLLVRACRNPAWAEAVELQFLYDEWPPELLTPPPFSAAPVHRAAYQLMIGQPADPKFLAAHYERARPAARRRILERLGTGTPPPNLERTPVRWRRHHFARRTGWLGFQGHRLIVHERTHPDAPGQLWCWDPESQPRRFGSPIFSAAFLPLENSARLLALHVDGARLWSLEPIATDWGSDHWQARSNRSRLQISPDGRLVFLASEEFGWVVLDAASGALVRRDRDFPRWGVFTGPNRLLIRYDETYGITPGRGLEGYQLLPFRPVPVRRSERITAVREFGCFRKGSSGIQRLTRRWQKVDMGGSILPVRGRFAHMTMSADRSLLAVASRGRRLTLYRLQPSFSPPA